MANKVLLEVELTSKGVKIVEKQIDDTTKAINENTSAQQRNTKSTRKGSDARNAYQRQEKGVGQITSNTTKAFSKQAQFINGGLVPAYAAIAANVFALSSFFLALQKAAQFEKLAAGLETLGTASGIALKSLSSDLQKATGYALSLEEAMRSTNLVVSAGFDSSTIERLGVVAKNASTALGRDLQDSLSRLTRGATKLEPELLDELGIMVRLDEAAENYASELGKTASQLTNFEKRQAFMNAVLEEGERKFGALNEVDPSAYDKLSASFADLSKSLLNIVNVALKPFIFALSESKALLFAVFAAFGSTILKSIAPGISDLGARYDSLRDSLRGATQGQIQTLSVLTSAPAKFGEVNKYIEKTGDVVGGLEMAQKKLRGSTGGLTTSLNKVRAKYGENSVEAQRLTALLNGQKTAYDAVTVSLGRVAFAQAIFNKEQQITTLIATGRFAEAWTGVVDLFKKDLIPGFKDAGKGMGLFGKITEKLGRAFGGAASAGRILMTVLATAGPIAIGLSAVAGALTLAFTGVQSFYYWLYPENKKLNEDYEQLTKTVKELSKTYEQLNRFNSGLSSTFSSVTQAVEAAGNSFSTTYNELDQVLRQAVIAGETDVSKEYTNNLVKIIRGNDELAKSFEEIFGGRVEDTLKRFVQGSGNTVTSIKLLRRVIDTVIKPAAELNQKLLGLSKSLTSTSKTVRDLYNTFSTKTPFDQASADLIDLQKNFENLKDQAPEKQLALIEELASKGGLKDILPKATLDNLKNWKELSSEGIMDLLKGIKGTIKAESEFVNAQKSSFNASGEKIKMLEAINSGLSRQAQTQSIISYTIQNERAIIDQKITQKRIELQMTQRALDKAEREKATTEEITRLQNQKNRILQEQAALSSQIVTKGEEDLRLAEGALKLLEQKLKPQRELLALQLEAINTRKEEYQVTQRQLTLENKLKNIRAKLDSEETPTQKLARLNSKGDFDSEGNLAENGPRAMLMREETKLKKAQLDMEKQLLDVKLRILNMELNLLFERGEIGETEYNKQILLLKKTREAALGSEGMIAKKRANIDAEEKNRRMEAELEFAEARKAASDYELTNTLRVAAEIQEAYNGVLQTAMEHEQKLLTNKLSFIDAQEKIEKDALRVENEKKKGLKNRELTAAQEASITDKYNKERDKLINKSVENQTKIIDAEYALLRAKAELQKAEMLILQQKLQAEATKTGDKGLQEQATNLAGVIEETFSTLLGPNGAIEQARQAAIANVGITAAAQTSGTTDTQNAGRAATQEELLGAAGQGSTVYDRIGSLNDAGGFGNIEETSDKITAMRSLVTPFMDDLAKLGPEGELIAAIGEAAFSIGVAWTTALESMGEKGATTTDKLAAGFAAAAATIGAISSIMKASSDQQIAAIDQQIAAEQKRDGKSKESVAKLKALEAKKEQMKRKQFEKDKKMKMAEVVMNTAAAIMGLWSGVKDPYVGPVIAGIQMGIVAALGAAQLAVIAGTSYQGGGGSISASAGPSQVSMGDRKSTVDLAKSKSASGELAYFRGESGIGGPEEFKGAFMGAKYRKDGGPTTGYVVGEQGPELFVPQVPGNIIPNDKMNTTTNQNVNISISAIDASGVQDVLMAQRGNIIGMIREAANNIGEEFYENIDTTVYSSGVGAKLY